MHLGVAHRLLLAITIVTAAASCASDEGEAATPTSTALTTVTATPAPTTGPPLETAPAVEGAALFAAETLGPLDGCTSCHSLEPGRSTSGPSLTGIGTAAATRVPGVDAQAYLRQSILDPEAVFAPGWGAGMPAYGSALSDADVDALVDFLSGLE